MTGKNTTLYSGCNITSYKRALNKLYLGALLNLPRANVDVNVSNFVSSK